MVMKEVKINLNQGQLVLSKPKAGVRNKAIMKAETAEGMKQSSFMFEIIPHCVKSHPWGTTPIRQALDDLEIEEYDKIIEAAGKLFVMDEEDQKNSKELSGANDTPKV